MSGKNEKSSDRNFIVWTIVYVYGSSSTKVMTQHKFSGLTFLMADWSTYMFIRSSIEGRTLALMTMSASATFFDLNSDVFSFAAHISIVMFKSPRPGVSRIVNLSVSMASNSWVHDYGLLLVLKPS